MNGFTEEERVTIWNACHVANERFRENVEDLKASELSEPDKSRLIEQFESQIKDTTAVMEKFEP